MYRSTLTAVAYALLAAIGILLSIGNAQAAEQTYADDRQQVLDLISMYGRTYDDRDAEAWSALFIDNAPLTIFSAGNLARKLGSNEERKKWAISRFETFDKDGVSKTRHFQTNTILELVNDNAMEGTTLFFVTFQYASESTPRPIHTGIYKDRFVKTSEGWKFSKRQIFIDHK